MKGLRPAGYIRDEISHLDLAKTSSKTSNWAIVAIPEPNDYTWRISSEKVPHLTILFLGKQSSPVVAQQMADFLEHVAGTSLTRFGLQVDERGVLGEEEADVLFFSKKYMTKRLMEVRSYLLTNPQIYQAYNSAPQYPSWTPHLTMGYPETPARPDLREYPGFSWVEFDRVALWTGDYEGPEFQLKRDDGEEMSMSEASSDFLAHYGVKGMKWGVRKDRSGSSSSGSASARTYRDSADAEAAKNTLGKIHGDQGRTDSLSNKELKSLIERMNLERQYSNLSAHPNQIQNGQNYFDTAMKMGQNVNKAIAFSKSPAGKILIKLLKTQFASINLAMKVGKAGKAGVDLVRQ